MVEVLGDHVEGFIGSVSDEEEIASVTESEDGGLHVGGTEDNLIQSGQA